MAMTRYHDLAKSKNQMIQFVSVTTGQSVEFPAFVTRFTDNFNVSWGTEQSFGRVDPVKPYQSTTRRITLGFTVLASSEEMANENLTNYSKLIQMLYPVYSEPLAESGGNSLGRTIKAPPILRVKMMNYIQSPSGDGGLLGCISGLDFTPEFEAGHFIRPDGTIAPILFNVSFTFDAQHDQELGFGKEGFLSSNFPYGQTVEQTPSLASSGRNENEASLQTSALSGN
tara:strand:- start:481 stop:1161 length:681 start_codon:yes stop_codon:yes gene_type:complete